MPAPKAARLLVHLDQAGIATEDTMNDAQTVYAAADIGNASAEIAVLIDGKVTVIKLPTAKGYPVSLPARLAADEPVIIRDGYQIALGWTALRYIDEPVSSRGNEDRYGRYILDFILYGIARAAKSTSITVAALAVTVPAEFFDRAGAAATALKGNYTIELDGRSIAIAIRKVMPVSEGEAAWHGLKGKSIGRTIVIDGGGGQTHVAIADGDRFGKVKTRATGMQKSWDLFDAQIKRQHGRRLTMLERAELEQAIAEKRPYNIIVEGKPFAIDHLARPLLSRVAELAIDDVKEIIPAWRSAATIWLCGGQAFHLADLYQAAFPQIKVAPKPDEANARGALAMISKSEVSNEG